MFTFGAGIMWGIVMSAVTFTIAVKIEEDSDE